MPVETSVSVPSPSYEESVFAYSQMATQPILLILDVDETLLHATERPLDHKVDFRCGPYHVYRRPHVEAFLRRCAQQFRLAVWSSSTEDYLAGVLAQTVPRDVTLEFTWSRTRCVQRFDPEWHTHYYVKDLKKVKRLGFDLGRVLVVDDTPQKLERNYGNAIYIKPYVGSLTDDELPRLQRYLETLVDADDVRRVEKRDWHTTVVSE